MKRVLAGAWVAVFASCVMFGQVAATAPAPAFEVASVKPNNSVSGESHTQSSRGEIKMENVSLKQCIEMAFDVKDYSLSGPPWLDSVRLDIVAKAPAGTPADQLNPMLQSLLAERFKLSVHRESKLLSAYALLVDKNGTKIEPVKPGTSGTTSGRGLLKGTNVSMAQFADMLSRNLDRPVKDLTDVKGVFDFKLTWTPDELQPADSPAAVSLFAAVREQLGLRLEAQKLPIEILVIDHVEKVPTEN